MPIPMPPMVMNPQALAVANQKRWAQFSLEEANLAGLELDGALTAAGRAIDDMSRRAFLHAMGYENGRLGIFLDVPVRDERPGTRRERDILGADAWLPSERSIAERNALWLETRSTWHSLADGLALIFDPDKSPAAELERRIAFIRQEAKEREKAEIRERERSEKKAAEEKVHREKLSRWRAYPRAARAALMVAAEHDGERIALFLRELAEAMKAEDEVPTDPPADGVMP